MVKHQDAKDQHQGQGYGEIAVVLDLPRIGDSDGGCTDGRNLYFWMLALSQFGYLLDQIHDFGIALGITTREGRREEGKAFVATFVEEVFVLHAVVLRGVERIEPLQGGRIKVERVGLDALHHKARRGHGERPLDVGHTGGHMVGVGQQGVHALVIAFRKEQGLVFADEVDGVKYLAAVDTALQVADDLGGICFLPMAFKGIHGLHYRVDGFIACQLGGVGSKDNRDLALIAQVVVDRCIAFLFGVGG
jgi:hypothetical protein